MRTSLQSFRFLPKNPYKPRPAKVVEITRTSLQSLVPKHFDAFYCVLFATHDCALHNLDDPLGILSDTCGPEKYSANVYYGIDVANDSLSFSLLFSYWLYFVEHFDMPWRNSIADSLSVDYNGIYDRNDGR